MLAASFPIHRDNLQSETFEHVRHHLNKKSKNVVVKGERMRGVSLQRARRKEGVEKTAHQSGSCTDCCASSAPPLTLLLEALKRRGL